MRHAATGLVLALALSTVANAAIIVEGELYPEFAHHNKSLRVTIFDFDTVAEIAALPLEVTFPGRFEFGDVDEVREWRNAGGVLPELYSPETFVPLAVGSPWGVGFILGDLGGPITSVRENVTIPEPGGAAIWCLLAVGAMIRGLRDAAKASGVTRPTRRGRGRPPRPPEIG